LARVGVVRALGTLRAGHEFPFWEDNEPKKGMMMTKALSVFAALAVAFGATSAMAQSTGGSPADPNTNQNKQPGPSAGTPSDPAAGSSPAARVPTSPPGTGSSASEGASSGESGVTSPAGIPADPNTTENVQPGPGTGTPSDPAAGSKPSARVPTAPVQ
jgi:hypothetical protein